MWEVPPALAAALPQVTVAFVGGIGGQLVMFMDLPSDETAARHPVGSPLRLNVTGVVPVAVYEAFPVIGGHTTETPEAIIDPVHLERSTFAMYDTLPLTEYGTDSVNVAFAGRIDSA